MELKYKGYKRISKSTVIPINTQYKPCNHWYYWVAVKELKLSYYHKESLFIVYYIPTLWQIILSSLTATQNKLTYSHPKL